MRFIHLLVASILFTVLAAGCSNETELAKVREEAAAARAEAARARAEAEMALAELAKLKLKGDPAKKPGVKNQLFPEQTALAKQFLDLHATYKKGAVSLQEWTKFKRSVLETIPDKSSPQDADTLGKRLLDIKKAYDQNAVSLQEWSQIKTKVIAQTPVENGPLNQELLDLKEAYDGNAVSLQEWTRAKTEISKRLKGN